MSEQRSDDGSLPTAPQEVVERLPDLAVARMLEDGRSAGAPFAPGPELEGAAGYVMFDTPTAADDTIIALVPRDKIGDLPSQAAVRIASKDGRVYKGIVVRGPFALPDGLKPDAPPVVATALRGGFFMPDYHGLVEIEILGEELGGVTRPHRFRPVPNSPVLPLSTEEVRQFLGTGGDIRLGLAYGHDDLEIAFPSRAKEVLPRHTGILGTTGGGKSTSVANAVDQLQRAGAAVILLDTEGEYTEMNEPADHPAILKALAAAGREPRGVADTELYFLVGRDSSNPLHPARRPFSPRFDSISPYAVEEILEIGDNDAQQQRFQKALEVTVRALDQFVWDDADRTFVKEGLDEFDQGYPRMRLSHLYDVVRATADKLESKGDGFGPTLKSPEFSRNANLFVALLDESIKNVPSWRKLQGKLGRIERLGIFDNQKAASLDYARMIQPGKVSIIDLSDTDSTFVNNLIISDLLHGVQKAQDAAYQRALDRGVSPTPVVIIIEEAHEFLSSKRIGRMETLHQQVERIAKRGRKRWLGLVFVTQLPQHLPDEILGLVNNFILHKIGDANVVSRLKRAVGGVDEALWTRLPRLAPGQAIVSLATLARPMLTAMDPAPCKLRMVR